MVLIEWITLGVFFLLLFGILWWTTRKKNKTSADYFLAGKDAGWIAIGASIFASNIGSEHLVGLAGAGASSGMAMAHWELQGWLILVLGWVFVPFYFRSKVFTMPEFLERRFNAASRTILSVISIVSYILTKVAVTVYAGGIVFKEVFGINEFMGIDFFWIGAIGLVIITGIYTVVGGMKSVLYTSVLQTPVLLIGSLVILVIGLNRLGGWDELMRICQVNLTANGDSMTSLFRSKYDPDFPWTGIFFGSAITGFWYWCTDQYIVQRVLSGRDQKQARRGTIFGAYLKLLPVLIFLIPGLIAFALNQKGMLDLSSSDAAYSAMVSQLLPIGLKGLVVGGIIAALMSSLASLFNSTALLFTVDFYKKLRPDTSEKRLVVIGRIATVVIVVLGVLWIPVMKSIGKVLYAYLQDVQSLLAPGIAAAFLLGVFWKRATPASGVAGLLTGFIFGMARLVLRIFSDNINPNSLFYKIMVEPNWLHFAIFLFLGCVLAIVIVSIMTKPKIVAAGLTYDSATPGQLMETRRSWNHWDVINTIVIVLIIVAVYWYFWN